MILDVAIQFGVARAVRVLVIASSRSWTSLRPKHYARLFWRRAKNSTRDARATKRSGSEYGLVNRA
jgi:hypothetical protein